MSEQKPRWRQWIGARAAWMGLAVFMAIGAAAMIWRPWVENGLPEGFAGSNGRVEAVEIDVATRLAGRLQSVSVKEGDFVESGDRLARMDTASLEARLHEAEAQAERARIGVDTAERQVEERQSRIQTAEAVVRQREAELNAARKRLERTRQLVDRGSATPAQLDEDEAAFEGAQAAVSAAEAEVASARAALGAARSGTVAANAELSAAQATVERIQSDLDEAVLRAPRSGRVQYRVAEPGEVLAAGGPVLNLVDLTDVYMTFFLPTAEAGRTAIGAEARIVLDAAPDYVIPAQITFVADEAQFTPKTVETEQEREKLMFRLKASIDPELLRRHLRQVKTGLPGMAYVRIDPEADWPADLQVNLPE